MDLVLSYTPGNKLYVLRTEIDYQNALFICLHCILAFVAFVAFVALIAFVAFFAFIGKEVRGKSKGGKMFIASSLLLPLGS